MKKALLVVFIMCFLFAMLLSGTRGAYVLVPVSLIPLAILKYSKKILLIVIGMGIVVAGLIFVPTGNRTLNASSQPFAHPMTLLTM